MNPRSSRTPLTFLGRRWSGLDLRTKFNLVLVAFLLPATTVMSLAVYYFQKDLIREESGTKAWIVLREASAIRRYVEDVLRPRMYSLLGTDQFVIEAMSTTFVMSPMARASLASATMPRSVGMMRPI